MPPGLESSGKANGILVALIHTDSKKTRRLQLSFKSVIYIYLHRSVELILCLSNLMSKAATWGGCSHSDFTLILQNTSYLRISQELKLGNDR